MKGNGPMSLVKSAKVIAGGADDFATVTHLLLAGSNREIGRELASIAIDELGAVPTLTRSPLKTRGQRLYMRRHYPIHYERMCGVAEAFGKDVEDDRFDFSLLPYHWGKAGCTVTYYPPSRTVNGHGMMGRNFDYSLGDAHAQRPEPGMMPVGSRPYLFEIYPDDGYPSLYMGIFDMLGTCDGINSEGLTVAIMTDDEAIENFPIDPSNGPAVGFEEFLTLRFLLDTCATVEEAKEALLLSKHYYRLWPYHYLIADRHGDSFVWEYSQAHNQEYYLDNHGAIQFSSNHPLHLYDTLADLPLIRKYDPGLSYPRFRTLARALADESATYSLEDIKRIDLLVSPETLRRDLAEHLRPGEVEQRSLWHSIYDIDERRIYLDFYLRDQPVPDNSADRRMIRSQYYTFQLEGRAVE
jgi:hypothetical protein